MVSINRNDCPVTIPDMNNAQKIFGPILGGTGGKTLRQKPYNLTKDCVAIPGFFLVLTSFVSLVTDVMFVKQHTFLNYHVSWF